MSTPEQPAEFNFPLSFTGPDGIGATPFEDYGVSVLWATQAELSDRFAGRSANAEPRFLIVKDTPLVDGALAHFVARVEKSYWGGDHSLFLGRVEYARQNPGTPLLFHGGRYEKLGA